MEDFLDRRLIVTMGKGGVGKSFVTAALAHLALKRGKRVLLVQVNTKDKISSYLGCERASEDIREVAPNLFSVNIRPESALKEYVILQVKLELIYRLVFENRAVRYFLRAVPALKDLVTLGKVHYHVMQKEKRSKKPLYDLVLLDAPPTGHGLFLLNLPNVMLRAVQKGPVKKAADEMLAMLQDPQMTIINLVTLPEEMPVAETEEMFETIAQQYKMPLGCLFVNSIFPKFFEPGDEPRLQQLTELTKKQPKFKGLLRVGRISQKRRQMAERYLGQLTERIPLPEIHIPYLYSESFGPETTEKVADLIERALDGRNGH